jgi:hypothetical protein
LIKYQTDELIQAAFWNISTAHRSWFLVLQRAVIAMGYYYLKSAHCNHNYCTVTSNHGISYFFPCLGGFSCWRKIHTCLPFSASQPQIIIRLGRLPIPWPDIGIADTSCPNLNSCYPNLKKLLARLFFSILTVDFHCWKYIH